MEHFEKRWVKKFSRENGWQISIKSGWSFAGAYGQENDPYGELTAQRIIDYHNLVVPALRAVWKYWSDINTSDPNAEGHDTIELMKKAIKAIGE